MSATARKPGGEAPGLQVVTSSEDVVSASPAKAHRLPPWLDALIREPLIHFLVVGVLLFAASQAWRTANDLHTVVVTPETVASLATKYRLQFGEAPTTSELERLIDLYVEEEVLYREGRALGLDDGDEIVRRRIAQKTEFLLQDREAPAEPTEAQLRAFYAAAAARYAEPVRTSFSHLYFSPDGSGEVAARARAEEALSRLRAGAPSNEVKADRFPDLNTYAAMAPQEAARVFGESELAAAVAQAPRDAWSGPYRSGYGWHLVHVSDRAPGGRRPFSAVAARVREDLLADQHAKANARAISDLRRRYSVVRRDREATR